ncbi:actin family [Helicostylum pulchrum]|uniref:Actin-related protein n=1 Tax=Helicostylum pulchrum TaxID=562976 RepID=A0ABP9Y9J8_9FUNG|nr:actin family [Helicostylum pulchrum]
MSIALREENFVVINVGSKYTTAGIGMHDTNKPPNVIINMDDFNHPIKNNVIVNWKDLEECWHHILFKELGIKKSRNESPVLIAVPVQWTKLDHERITQIFFENFNVPGVYIAPQPLLTLFGCGTVSGIVVDIGSETTDVNIIVDSNIQLQSTFSVPIAGDVFDDYFLQLLKKDTKLVQHVESLADVELNLEFARYVRELPGICNVSIGHELADNMLAAELLNAMEESEIVDEILDDEQNPKKIEEEEVGDVPEVVEIEYKGHKFTIGPYRHDVLDPLFSPDLVNIDSPSLTEAMRLSAMNCEPPEIRPKLWENIAIAGGCCNTVGLARRIKTEVQLFLPHSENAGDTQPRQLSFLRIADYFTILKDKKYQQYSTWLGAEIVAKLVFIDAKNYISKVDYNESGPSVVHTKAY